MLVTFTRLSADGNLGVRAVRADGVVLAIEGYSRKGYIPHDMMHFVGEQAFGVTNGFWGSVADGALFKSLRVTSGKLRHDAWGRSKALIKANAEGLRLGELIGGPAYAAVERGWDLETAYKALVRTWTHFQPKPLPYDRELLRDAIMAFADAREQWQSTPVGGELELAWRQSERRRQRFAAAARVQPRPSS
jgi:hypothetical protein